MEILLKELIKESDYTYKSLAQVINDKYGYKTSKESIAKYANNQRTPEPKLLVLISKIFNVSSDYILGIDTNKIDKSIPLIGRASCRTPQEYSLENYESVPISNKLYKNGMYAVITEGNSMSPKIENNYIVYCNPTIPIKNGDIVHYNFNGENGIKKYKRNEKQTIISLVPLNSDYDIIIIDEFHHLMLTMAKVVGSVDTNF